MELPSDDTLRALVTRYAQLRAAHGDAIGTPPLVLPNGDFFPDAFAPSPEGVATLLRRAIGYAPVADDLHLELAFLVPDEEEAGGGCSSGACAPGQKAGGIAPGIADETDLGYRVHVRASDVGDPALLTASLARSLGAITLAEAGETIDPRTLPGDAEIAAAVCGFGALLLHGACVYRKSCGGLREHQGTYLGVTELASLLALFVRLHDVKPSLARGPLEATQREALDMALRWVDARPKMLAALRSDPASLERGVLPTEESKGLFGRLFAKRAATDDDMPSLDALAPRPRRERTEAELRRLEETKALVDEALRAR